MSRFLGGAGIALWSRAAAAEAFFPAFSWAPRPRSAYRLRFRRPEAVPRWRCPPALGVWRDKRDTARRAGHAPHAPLRRLPCAITAASARCAGDQPGASRVARRARAASRWS